MALLLKAGADPNSADRAGRTPLMFAGAQGRLELVQILLAGGADVEAKAANGKSPSNDESRVSALIRSPAWRPRRPGGW